MDLAKSKIFSFSEELILFLTSVKSAKPQHFGLSRVEILADHQLKHEALAACVKKNLENIVQEEENASYQHRIFKALCLRFMRKWNKCFGKNKN